MASELLDRGVMVRAIGDSVAFCPPMIITEEQLNELEKGIVESDDDNAIEEATDMIIELDRKIGKIGDTLMQHARGTRIRPKIPPERFI